jgi:hypothetical protein
MTNELTGLTGRAVHRLGDTHVLPIGLGCQAMSGVTDAHLNELRRCASDAHRLFLYTRRDGSKGAIAIVGSARAGGPRAGWSSMTRLA